MRTYAYLCCFLLLPTASARAQPPCAVPRLLFSLDKSSSMREPAEVGQSKWNVARNAVTELVEAFGDRIEIGLQVFPHPDRCEPGSIRIEPALGQADALVEALGGPPPEGGHWTPLAQTLAQLADYAPMLEPDRARHVVLLTAGCPWCSPYDRSTRVPPVEEVQRLTDLGMTVHLIGFGVGVDSLTLNRAALAAGTAIPGCDPTLSEPGASGHCYHQAHDAGALRRALSGIARALTEESCDGVDNDCDNAIDEGFDADADGYPSCEAGDRPADCDDADPHTHPGAIEHCDGRDTNCDGSIDTGCACIEGATHACGLDRGACTPGLQRCLSGAWTTCEGGVAPREEDACDGTDDDCDGAVDEHADCGLGSLCVEGSCAPVEPMEPPATEPMPEVDEPPPMAGGCGCRTQGDDPAGLALVLLPAWAVGFSRRGGRRGLRRLLR